MSDDDNEHDSHPEPANLDRPSWANRPPPPPHIRQGYRLDDDTGILYGADGRPRCSAKARNAPGGVCHAHRNKGATRCRMHGGSSPKSQQKAARDRVEADVRELLATMDIGPVHDPLTALKNLAGEVLAWKDAMRLKVEELDRLDVSTEYGEAARAVVQLFERAMDRAGEFLFKIARLNIDERLAAVTESQAKMIEDGFFDALDEAGIPPTDMTTREKVAVAFARHLSVVPS
jgi:hypothetical protein